jgi:hypothetical protein
VGTTLSERELRDTTSSSSTTRLSTAIRTRRPLSGISDERPICREFASPYDQGLIVQRSTSLSKFVRGPALTALALALTMFEQTFGHQKLSIGRGQTAATTSRTVVPAFTAVRRSPTAQRSG